MVEELKQNLFRIEIPLPESPLKYLNTYVVRSTKKNLLIDTGLNHKKCLDVMISGLKEIDVTMERTDIFITHFHADHFSLVPQLSTPFTKVLFNRPDAELIESWQGFEVMIDYAGFHGFPENELQRALKAHPAKKFGNKWVPEFKIIEDGEQINYGDYTFTCIATPGHTVGHTCLYEPEKKIFISGDHILIDITPNIQCWSDDSNPLKSYLESLEKVRHLDVELVLPGHRRTFSDFRGRILELKRHHRHRLDEILDILKNTPLSAYDTASKMTWDIKSESWEAFPVAQKLFATYEALSHLRYLENAGQIGRETINGIVRFFMKV